MWIIMQIFLHPEKLVLRLEYCNQVGIGIFEKLSSNRRHLGLEATVQPHTMQHGHTVFLSKRQIVYAISGRNMHNPGAIFGTDKISGNHLKTVFRIGRFRGKRQIIK